MDSRSPRALIDTPPVWLVVCIALVWAQVHWLPLLPTPEVVSVAGLILCIVAVALFAAATREFRRHHTTIVPRETPAALLTGGPYAWSRNPIYLADAALLCGVVLMWDAASLPLVALFVAVIQTRFILWEEDRCRATFGPDWQVYTTRVRRWL
jgi:protein-S-isoprenylcysteine O-methyltransferase Ste14